jgi:uncharacterized protein (DUF4415 family)
MSEERITRVTLAQARKMKGLTDWERVRSTTDEEIDRAIAEDPDAAPAWTEEEWKNARVVWPTGKTPVTLRLDRDIVAWFKLHGHGYQTRINAVLRAFVDAQEPRGWGSSTEVSSPPPIKLNRPKRSKGAGRR